MKRGIEFKHANVGTNLVLFLLAEVLGEDSEVHGVAPAFLVTVTLATVLQVDDPLATPTEALLRRDVLLGCVPIEVWWRCGVVRRSGGRGQG